MTIDKRIKFGGGGSQDHIGGGGYQGKGGETTGGGKGSQAGGEGTGTDGKGGTGGEGKNAGNTTKAKNTTPKKATKEDVKEQYRLNTPTKLGSTIKAPDKTKVGKGSTQYNNYIDALNLRGETYKPLNIPAYIPGSTLINTTKNFLGGLSFDKNKDFFQQNVAGKYGFGYGIDAYNDYMKQRMAGEVGAYGNVEQGQNALNGRSGGDNQGIMQLQYATPVGEINPILSDTSPTVSDTNPLLSDIYFNFGTFDDPIYKEDLISIEDLI
jgi:hypothetical protein